MINIDKFEYLPVYEPSRNHRQDRQINETKQNRIRKSGRVKKHCNENGAARRIAA